MQNDQSSIYKIENQSFIALAFILNFQIAKVVIFFEKSYAL